MKAVWIMHEIPAHATLLAVTLEVVAEHKEAKVSLILLKPGRAQLKTVSMDVNIMYRKTQ